MAYTELSKWRLRSQQPSPATLLCLKLLGLWSLSPAPILPWLLLISIVPFLINPFFPVNLLHNPSDW